MIPTSSGCLLCMIRNSDLLRFQEELDHCVAFRGITQLSGTLDERTKVLCICRKIRYLPRDISVFSPTAWKAWGSSNKASGWFGAAARNLAPGSARFRAVPHKGSILKSSGSERFHIKVPFLKVQLVPGGSGRFHIQVPFVKVEVPQGST